MFKDRSFSWFHHLSWLVAIRVLFFLLSAAGTGLWAALLVTHQPAPLPPALPAATTQTTDTTPLARWFGAGTARLRVALVGFITTDPQGAALLSINGGAPQAYRTGQTLALGVTLIAVAADGVLIEQDGAPERLPAPAKPAAVKAPAKKAAAAVKKAAPAKPAKAVKATKADAPAAKAAKTTVNPAAAWPFPTGGSRP